jgi:hypothetical protein
MNMKKIYFAAAAILLCLASGAFAGPNSSNTGTGGGVSTDSNCNQSQYYAIGKLCQDSDDGKLYKGTGTGILEIAAGASTGDFTGPASSATDNFVSFSNTGGKTGKDSGYSAASFQAAHAALASIAGLTETKGGMPYFTADNTWAVLAHPGASNYILYTNAADTEAWLLAAKLIAINTLANSAGYLKNDGSGNFSYDTPAGGGYTNLTSFTGQTAWRLFYSNASGVVTELALGANGTYLKSNGASAAPTFDTPSGSGATISDTAYDATSWDAVTDVAPSKNAIRDYLESRMPVGADGTYGVGLKNNTSTVTTPAGYAGIIALVNNLPAFRIGAGTIIYLQTDVGITGKTDSTNTTSSTVVASATAVKAAYDLANGKQAADQDLTDIAALSCTENQILKKGASAWGCGTDNTGAGGSVVASGTPTNHQWASWSDATTLKGSSVTASKVACSDSNGDPVACTNVQDVAYPTVGGANTWTGAQTIGDGTSLQKRVFLKPSSMSDHDWQGEAELGTAGEAISRGQLLYRKKNSGAYKWYLYDANDATIKTYDPTGVALADISSGNDGLVLTWGLMRDDTWSLTATNDTSDTTVYASTTAGGLIKTAPASAGDTATIVGHIKADNTIMFRFGYARVTK